MVSLGSAAAELPEPNDLMLSVAKAYVPDMASLKRYQYAELDALFIGDTVLLSLPRGRFRVVYFAEDGVLYTWFPGRDYIGKADFGIVDGAAICVDSVTRPGAGRAEVTCQPIEQLTGYISDRKEGDLFGLSSREAPPWSLLIDSDTISIDAVEASRPDASE